MQRLFCAILFSIGLLLPARAETVTVVCKSNTGAMESLYVNFDAHTVTQDGKEVPAQIDDQYITWTITNSYGIVESERIDRATGIWYMLNSSGQWINPYAPGGYVCQRASKVL